MIMTPIEQDILLALRDLETSIKSMPIANPKPDLLALFSRIDDLTVRLPKDTDPALVHYLHRKSYEKARLWLEGREEENQKGNCRH